MSDGGEVKRAGKAETPDSEQGRTYAQALLNAADNQGRADAVLDELDELIADVWTARPEFALLLQSPAMPVAEKDRILVEAFEGRADPLLLNFLRVLNRNGRLDLLIAVARQARIFWENKQGSRRVIVRTALPLDEAQLAALHGTLTTMAGRTPIVRQEVDPDLIGGLVVQIGDHVYDASIRTHLRNLRHRLVEEKKAVLRRDRDAFTTFV